MLTTKESLILDTEIADLLKILNTKYAAYLKQRFFELEIGNEQNCILVTLTLRDQTNRFFYPVMAKINPQENELSQREAALLVIDYMDCYFEEYFKDNEGTYLNIDWAEHSFDDADFQMKGQILDLEKERLADEFLRNAGAN